MTSQILANVYLNEYDFFVRHSLKPLAYVRYGDDFILIFRTQEEAKAAQTAGTYFLYDELLLKVHSTNNIIVKACHGIRFLGVTTYSNSKTISQHDFDRFLALTDKNNYESYFSYINRYGTRKQKNTIQTNLLESKL